ncbi:MAG: alpha/beta hydrolase [Balneolaceae bacterium]
MTIESFIEQTLEMADDYEGRVVATLIRSAKNIDGRKAVLYIHGYNDYFFHAHLADKFHEQDYNFYALDLRKHGRSILPHQHQNYCRSLREYFEEINVALDIIHTENGEKITLLGHSTGGLISSYYMNKGKNRSLVDALVLNAPFLEFNLTTWQKYVIVPLSGLLSLFNPYAFKKKPFAHLYGSSISKKHKGEWEYNEEWKPIGGFPAYLKWVYAVYLAQRFLRKSSEIKVPILILHSDKSSRLKKWDDVIFESDMVLNVEHIKKYGRVLGEEVEFIEVKGGIHDIFLSSELVRNSAIKRMFAWFCSKN